MPEFQADSFGRPWIEGVAVVANLIADAVFSVDGVTRAELDAAVEVLRGHDELARADIADRLCSGDGLRLAGRPEADWLDGVEDALCALAGSIDFGDQQASPYSVVVTGVPVTRNEADTDAELAAVRTMIGDGVGLTVASCWPAPGTVSDLALAGRAGLIVALPNGHAVAARIAARTGARVIEARLPLGFDNTRGFLMDVAGAVGRLPRAGEYAQAGLGRIVPRFEWVVPHSLLNRRIGLVGDGAFIQAASSFLFEVGCDICRAGVTGTGSCRADLSVIIDVDPGEPVALMIGNSDLVSQAVARDEPFLESTFPCRTARAFYPRPTLGFDGAAAFLQDIVNRMAFFEIMESWKNTIVNEEDR